MKFCPNCGTLTYEETEICPGCGEPFRDIKRYCPNCGNEISPGDNYCMYCGTDVSGIPSMLNGSKDKRSNQKPKKPKRHRIRRFLIRLFEILLILTAILWCFAYYEDYDLRLKVYDMVQSTSKIVPSVKTVLGINDEEPAEEGTGDNDDETIIVETPGDARKVDIITIVIVNQAKEAALAAEDEIEEDIGPEEDGYPPESGEYDDFREFDDFDDIDEFRIPENSGEPDEFRIPERREHHETRRRYSSRRPERPQPSSMPPQRPGQRQDEPGSDLE